MTTLATLVLAVALAPTTRLQPGDRLAIIGDSITEQRLYSRNIATYLTACRPDLQVDVRQLGWSGETAGGFLTRMDTDCLRFKPTVATLCYGMNDACAQDTPEAIREKFVREMGQILERFEGADVRVLVGAPGILTKRPSWRKTPETAGELLGRLETLAGVARDLAAARGHGFADVFGSMSRLRDRAAPIHGERMEVAGSDGVHPGAAGQLAMASAFLHGFGFDGQDLARFTVDFRARRANASEGHRALSFDGRTLRLRSERYPFVLADAENPTHSARAAGELLGFTPALNRFVLQVTGLVKPRCEIAWGDTKVVATRAELESGVNLMERFAKTPFDAAFARVEERVGALQTFETLEVKMVFRSEEYKRAPDWRTSHAESVRDSLARAARDAVVPVHHTITFRPID